VSKQPSFGAELERLEAIVRALEDSEVDLDEALELFQEGVERLKTARKLLQETELTVQKVVRAADADLPDDDLDD
jgi:exodeoxyribonuclease VII small subunit